MLFNPIFNPKWITRFVLVISIFLLCIDAGTCFADIKITLEPIGGSSVSDVVTVVARVVSTADVDRVEFKLDKREAVVSKSVPYQYIWDTIKDTEGEHTLAVSVYDSKGDSTSISAAFIIDNDIKSGAESLALKAKSAHEQGKDEDASRFIRRSLKASPGNLSASMTASEIAASMSDWTLAVDALEKSVSLDKSIEALQKLTVFKIMQSLMPQNTAHLEEGLAAAVDYRRKADNLNIELIRQKSSDTSAASFIALGDALMQAGKFNEAGLTYEKAGDSSNAPTALTARIGLAFTLDNRLQETFALFRPLYRAKKNDSAIDTVQGLALLRLGQFDASRTIISKALTEHIAGAEIVSALITLTEGKKSLAYGEALSASTKLGESADAAYAVALTATDPHISDRSLISALTLSPLQTGPYLEMASRILLQKRPDKFDQAYQLIELSLSLDKDSLRAKLMRTLLLLEQNKVNIAETLLANLAKKKTNTPDYLMTLAVYWNMKHNAELSNRSLEAARKMDSTLFKFDLPSTPLELLFILNRKIHYRTDSFLSLASLFMHGS